VAVRCGFSQLVYLVVKTRAQKPSISDAQRRFFDQCAPDVLGDILQGIKIR
jgi:hypothetical protein